MRVFINVHHFDCRPIGVIVAGKVERTAVEAELVILWPLGFRAVARLSRSLVARCYYQVVRKVVSACLVTVATGVRNFEPHQKIEILFSGLQSGNRTSGPWDFNSDSQA